MTEKVSDKEYIILLELGTFSTPLLIQKSAIKGNKKQLLEGIKEFIDKYCE